LRQSAQRAEAPPSWKQEVNRRLAAHNGRKTAQAGQPEAVAGPQLAAGSVAAKAAARVAARYAKAPSYSEMLADEARAAVRAAEAASRAALEAQAAAESVLAGLEAATEAPRAWEAEFFSSADREPQWDEPMAPIQPVERMQKAHAVPNPAPAKPTAMVGLPIQLDRKTLLMGGGGAAGAIVLVFLFAMLLRKRKKKVVLATAAAELASGDTPAGRAALAAAQAQQDLESQLAERDALQQRSDAQVLTNLKLAPVITKKAEVLAKHLREKIAKEPDIAGQILRTWIREEEL